MLSGYNGILVPFNEAGFSFVILIENLAQFGRGF